MRFGTYARRRLVFPPVRIRGSYSRGFSFVCTELYGQLFGKKRLLSYNFVLGNAPSSCGCLLARRFGKKTAAPFLCLHTYRALADTRSSFLAASVLIDKRTEGG